MTSIIMLFPYPCYATNLSQIRVGQYDKDTLRLVIHLDRKEYVNTFTLVNPSRIVIDFANTTILQQCFKNIPGSLGFITQIRVNQNKDKTARIVLDIAGTPVLQNRGIYLEPQQKRQNWRYVLDIQIKKTSLTQTALPNTSRVLDSQKTLQNNTKQPKTEQHLTDTRPLIVLDPGHGGADPGAISRSGKYEKNLTLLMAKEIKKEIEKTGRYRVLLTREIDKAIPLKQRSLFAFRHQADLFISIHADSARNKKAKGLSVYTISDKASDKEAQLLAERENKADILLGTDLTEHSPEISAILIDLSQTKKMENSDIYANLLVKKMASNVTLVPNAHRFAGFMVLKSANIPSVLIEIGYLSNAQEERLLAQSNYRARLSRSIVQAIDSYFEQVQ